MIFDPSLAPRQAQLADKFQFKQFRQKWPKLPYVYDIIPPDFNINPLQSGHISSPTSVELLQVVSGTFVRI